MRAGYVFVRWGFVDGFASSSTRPGLSDEEVPLSVEALSVLSALGVRPCVRVLVDGCRQVGMARGICHRTGAAAEFRVAGRQLNDDGTNPPRENQLVNSRRVSSNSPQAWELGGESVIHCEVRPDPPVADAETTIRLTHSNSYGPVDDVTFYVRAGDPEHPTRFEDLDSAEDWRLMQSVEEIVWLDGEERYRSEVADQLDPREETVWAGTFEATLSLPEGQRGIEIKVVSKGHLQSGVISDWRLKVQSTE